MSNLLRKIKQLVPTRLFQLLAPVYHYLMAFLGAVIYRFPTRELTVVGITGTKGKTTVSEIINAILEENGEATALSNTVRFKVGDNSRRNLKKMSMPGRFFLQRLARKAVKGGCSYLVLEMTSQGALQSRHRFISLDELVFTNLSPEHIEAHGSYEKYRDAKLKIARQLEKSRKHPRIMVANTDDEAGQLFLEKNVDKRVGYSLSDARPFSVGAQGIKFQWRGKTITSPLPGTFNLYNLLTAATATHALGIKEKTIKEAVEKFTGVRGRLEPIDEGQDFGVYVDYAHTADSLEKVYKTFENKRKIAVLGNTGGGRDKWKRKEMAKIAEQHCARIILTNEDPYDENPRKIVEEMAKAISIPKYEVVMDRRSAIARAFEHAEPGDVVLITGKGTDPFIMGPNGSKQPWDDATVAREELTDMLTKNDTE